jgi:multicomponent Na+:H+ antiporter subunit C
MRRAAEHLSRLRREAAPFMKLLELLGYFNYWVFAIVLSVGLYTVIAKVNLVKKLIGLSIFQSAVFLMYITMDKVEGGTAPIIQEGMENQVFSNPVPQVLILTAIVVGVSTLALGLAIVVRINECYGTIEEDEILDAD